MIKRLRQDLLTDEEMALGPEKWKETMEDVDIIKLSLDEEKEEEEEEEDDEDDDESGDDKEEEERDSRGIKRKREDNSE